MSDAILKWLGGCGVGESSKAIALTALGRMPDHPSYPSDGDDFGRCYRLLQAAPEARAGLTALGGSGGPYWAALVPLWDDITKAYLSDIGEQTDGACYKLMKSILDPIEDRDPNVVRFGAGRLRMRPRRR